MAKRLDLNGRRFWIMSEPQGAGWKAFVVEMVDHRQHEIGIEATAEAVKSGGEGDNAIHIRIGRAR